jgi:hypothetical protein
MERIAWLLVMGLLVLGCAIALPKRPSEIYYDPTGQKTSFDLERAYHECKGEADRRVNQDMGPPNPMDTSSNSVKIIYYQQEWPKQMDQCMRLRYGYESRR